MTLAEFLNSVDEWEPPSLTVTPEGVAAAAVDIAAWANFSVENRQKLTAIMMEGITIRRATPEDALLKKARVL